MSLFGFGQRPTPPSSTPSGPVNPAGRVPVGGSPQKPAPAPKPFIGSSGMGENDFKFNLKKEFSSKPANVAGFNRPVYGSEVEKLNQTFKDFGAIKNGRYTTSSMDLALKKMQKEHMYTSDFKRKRELERYIKIGKQIREKQS